MPTDCEYTSAPPSRVPTYSQYCVTPVPLVQLNVTVDDAKLDPGAGDTICADPPGTPVSVTVGVMVGVTVLVGVGEGPTVDVDVAVRVGVAVLVGRGVPVPGPYV